MRITTALLVSFAAATHAGAQSFNIDMHVPGAGWGGGVPPATFGGASHHPAAWTAISAAGQTYQLLNRFGIPTGVTINATGVSGTASQNNANASGDFAKLMEDGLSVPTPDVSLFFTIEGLAPGKYFFYIYGGLTDYGEEAETLVSLLPYIGDQEVGGYPYSDNQFSEGNTHRRFFREISAGQLESVRISTRPVHSGAQGVITGMQIQKLPERLYVNASAPAGGDGQTWSTAFNTIQAALDQAQEWSGNIDEIWVAQGVYYPTTDTDQAAAIDLISGLASLYGGFAGTETARDQRDPATHPTTMSGNIGGPLPDDNSNTIVRVNDGYGNYGNEPAVVDGFNIIAGSGGYDTGLLGEGAGLKLVGGEALIRNCRFLNNEAENGAAVFATRGAATFVNCEFTNNTAASGGGAYANTVIAPNAGPVVRFINCRFHSNDAAFRGGALDVTGGATTLVNCVLTGNACFLDGGAIRATDSAQVDLLNCTIAGNTSSSLGGGAGGGLSLSSSASATLVNTIFWDNTAASAYNGSLQSQLAFNSGSLSVNYCTVQYYLPILLPGNANNGRNPQFVNATGGDGYGGTNDDVRLAAASPLIDSGSNLGLGQDWGDLDDDGDFAEQTPLDLDLNPRRVDAPATPNTNGGFGTPVDRGAFEFQMTGCGLPGDLDDDGDVDLSDLAMLLSHFGTPAGGAAEHGDIDGDGDVELSDLALLLSSFGQICP